MDKPVDKMWITFALWITFEVFHRFSTGRCGKLFGVLPIMIICLIITGVFSNAVEEKRTEIRASIGEKKLATIENFSQHNKICRITQLLSAAKIGKKTVAKLLKILGTRFTC